MLQLTNVELPLVPDVPQRALDLRLQIRGQRQKRESRGAAVVAVEVHAVLESGNTEIANSLRCLRNSFLLQTRQLSVAFFPCGIDLVAGRGRRAGEREDSSYRARVERWLQFVRRSHQHLESDFL